MFRSDFLGSGGVKFAGVIRYIEKTSEVEKLIKHWCAQNNVERIAFETKGDFSQMHLLNATTKFVQPRK